MYRNGFTPAAVRIVRKPISLCRTSPRLPILFGSPSPPSHSAGHGYVGVFLAMSLQFPTIRTHGDLRLIFDRWRIDGGAAHLSALPATATPASGASALCRSSSINKGRFSGKESAVKSSHRKENTLRYLRLGARCSITFFSFGDTENIRKHTALHSPV